MIPPAQEELRSRLKALGFDEARFARVDGKVGSTLRPWLAAGYQADMHWIERGAEKREDPSLVVSGARTMILLGVNYWPGAVPTGVENGPAWARYAQYADYHDTVKAALVKAGGLLEALYGVGPADYRYYVDTGPVLEREWAARAGLGFIGKNAMLISREFGNWLFLAAIVTSLDLVPDEPLRKPVAAPTAEGIGLLCGKCTRCMDACPTMAIRAPGVLDARLCISYQTIENRGIIPRELRTAIGDRIYGCDVCLDVCPWNRFAQESRRILVEPRYELAALPLTEILSLTPVRFAELFRGTPIKRLKLPGLLRNACIVTANTNATHCLPQLVSLARHESAMVRAHAVWAVRQLVSPTDVAGMLEEARSVETDPTVLAEYTA